MKDPYFAWEKFPRRRQRDRSCEMWRQRACFHPPLPFSVSQLLLSSRICPLWKLLLKKKTNVVLFIWRVWHVTSQLFLSSSCSFVPVPLRASHLPPVYPPRLAFSVSFLSDLPLLFSPATPHHQSSLPPTSSFLPSCSSSFSAGRWWNLGDQWREHKGNEARAGHQAHQEWRPTRPSGAQEGRWLCSRIWWVNLRKHSILPHLHTLSQGTPSGRWWVGGEKGKELNYPTRTLHPSLGQAPAAGRERVGWPWLSFWWRSLFGFGILGRWQFSGCCCPSCSHPLCFHVIALSLFTFWPRSRSSLLGLHRKAVGLISVLHGNINCLQGLNEQSWESDVFLWVRSHSDGSKSSSNT